MSENPTNGNGNGSAKSGSILVAIHRVWVEAGEKLPAKAELDKLKKEMLAAELAVDAAEEAVNVARDAKDAVALKAMKLCGTKQPLNIGGDIGVVSPTARGERAFYKRIQQIPAA